MSRLPKDPYLKLYEQQQKLLRKEPFARPPKGPLTDAKRLAKYESLVIALYEAIVDTNHSNYARCDHERWAWLMKAHEFELAHLREAAIAAMIRRDKGKCHFCGGDAKKCYPRHSDGRSCA